VHNHGATQWTRLAGVDNWLGTSGAATLVLTGHETSLGLRGETNDTFFTGKDSRLHSDVKTFLGTCDLSKKVKMSEEHFYTVLFHKPMGNVRWLLQWSNNPSKIDLSQTYAQTHPGEWSFKLAIGPFRTPELAFHCGRVLLEENFLWQGVVELAGRLSREWECQLFQQPPTTGVAEWKYGAIEIPMRRFFRP
jgi:hypothetical protein